MTNLSRYSPWIAAVVGAIYFAVAAAPSHSPAGSMDLEAFGQLPVVADGRVKPIDTVARASLMVISGRQTFRENQTAPDQPAVRWLLDVMTANSPFEGPAAKCEVFRIDNEQLLAFMELKLKPSWYRYSLMEIKPNYDKLDKKIQEIRERDEDEKSLDLFETKVMELAKHLHVFEQLMRTQIPLSIPPSAAGQDDWSSLSDANASIWREVKSDIRGQLEKDKIDLEKLTKERQAEFYRKAEEMFLRRRAAEFPAATGWADIFEAYRADNAKQFNKAVSDYRTTYLGAVPAADVSKADFESYFNEATPFLHCGILYSAVFLLACLSWLGFPGLNRAATGLALVTLAVHTAALGIRMYLQGRPPVTNLYSSAVFIGWGAVCVGLIMEHLYRNGLGNAVAGLCGFGSLVVAHFLALSSPSGDTMEMMQAVLDTNFWLATHVTIVTFGYTASLVAGFLGIAFILRGVFTSTLDRSAVQRLGGMVYGVVCFATLLSFTGTVLGGIWADQSWGRFWGWDPKENGALLVVIWNAMILHARWGGLVKQRGVAVLAALGNVVVTWSWFGTNQLGVGLHAYGGSSSRAFAIVVASLSFTLLAGIGLIPTQYWRSNKSRLSAHTGNGRPAPEPA